MIGDRIRKLRKEMKLTQKELSEKLEISPAAVGMYEQNRREPPYELLQKLSQIFSVTSDYLLFGDEDSLNSKNVIYKTRANDLSDIIENLKKDLSTKKGIMFKGELLEGEDIIHIFEAMKIGAEIALKTKDTK